ncbi:MAG: zinc ribbon domain-containing protein [Thermoplasmata archaeon]
MQCPSCGAELAEGAKRCDACGKDLPLGSRVLGSTTHVATETGAVVGKIGKGAIAGVKGFVRGAKKGYRGEAAEPAEGSDERKE